MKKLLLIPTLAFAILITLGPTTGHTQGYGIKPLQSNLRHQPPAPQQYKRTKVREYDQRTGRTSTSTCRSWGNGTVRCTKR